MFIYQANGKEYKIREDGNCWTIRSKTGKLEVTFKIDKALCATREEVQEFLEANQMTGGEQK